VIFQIKILKGLDEVSDSLKQSYTKYIGQSNCTLLQSRETVHLNLGLRNKIFIREQRLAILTVYCKKRFAIFPSPVGMSLTKLSLDGNNLTIPVQVSDIPAGENR
jgi:hypothetical protein